MLDVEPQQTVDEVQKPGVTQVYWRVHDDFASDQVGEDPGLQPFHELLGREKPLRTGSCLGRCGCHAL